MDVLNIGIIGTGRISDLHAIEYLQNPKTRITAVADIELELAKMRGAKWGVAADHIFQDYRDLLALKDVDLVEILLPHHLHRQATLDAAAAGKHISLQKPMALSIAQADEMIAAAEKAGVFFKVFENFIFYPPVLKAKELIVNGEIGDPLTIRIKSNAGVSPTMWDVPRAAQVWRFDPDTCGGGPLVFDDGHHKFSLAWFFMGMAEEVHAWIGTTYVNSGVNVGNLDTPAIVSWKFPGNRVGSLEVVYAPELVMDTNHYAQDDRIEITGTKGVIWVTRGHGKRLDIPPVILYRDRRTFTFSDMPVGWEHSFINSTRQMIDAFFKGEQPSLTAWEGREILRFALAAQDSARVGQSIHL